MKDKGVLLINLIVICSFIGAVLHLLISLFILMDAGSDLVWYFKSNPLEFKTFITFFLIGTYLLFYAVSLLKRFKSSILLAYLLPTTFILFHTFLKTKSVAWQLYIIWIVYYGLSLLMVMIPSIKQKFSKK